MSNLERIMKEQFPKVRGEAQALRDYLAALKELEDGELTQEAIASLIDPELDVSDHITRSASFALQPKPSFGAVERFEPGFSAVVIDGEGRLRGVAEQHPNAHLLREYGPGLRYALGKLGHELYAVDHGGASTSAGYRAVSNVLSDRAFDDIPQSERHHVGGATRIADNGTTFHAGVSGVVGTDVLRGLQTVHQDHSARLVPIVEAALADEAGVLDNFRGNMFAGSFDSSLAAHVLDTIPVEGLDATPYRTHVPHFAHRALSDVALRHHSGINVH